MVAYSRVNDTFVNYYDVWGAVCILFTNARFQIKITSTSQAAVSGSHHFSVSISDPLFMQQIFWSNTTECSCTNGPFIVRYNNSIFILVKWLTADTCHVNDTKHISDLYIVGSYITFLVCILNNMSFGANVGASATKTI